MLPSLRDTANKLSKLQRDFLIDHVDGMRRFANQPIENATRESLIDRRFIRYQPYRRSKLGVPDGTMLTEIGREVLCYILSLEADNLARCLTAREQYISFDKEKLLYDALSDAARHWRNDHFRQREVDFNTPTDGVNRE